LTFLSAFPGEVNVMTRAVVVRHLTVLRIHIALTLAVSVAIVESVATCQTQAPPRVRSQGPLIASAIAEGMGRSETFRRLVQAIETTDGVVYVIEGKCGNGVRGCLALSVSIAGPDRILRIIVEPRKAMGCELVALIGHELQHAIEVLSNPRIRSDGEIYAFFDRVGRSGIETFETDEARLAGMDVEREACRSKRKR
jgi:hypothetical protein